jgi:hypothetical protein
MDMTNLRQSITEMDHHWRKHRIYAKVAQK